jgi:hypothetical protein
MHTISRVSAALQRTTRQGNTLQYRNAQRRTAMQCDTIATRTHPYLKIHAMRQVSAAVMHCNALQHTATLYNALQHTATHCNTLQHTATHCNTPPYTTQHCNTFVTHTHPYLKIHAMRQVSAAVMHCNALPHTATLYNALQHTATHCNTLQYTAIHCNTLQYTLQHNCNTHCNKIANYIHPYPKIHAISQISAAL